MQVENNGIEKVRDATIKVMIQKELCDAKSEPSSKTQATRNRMETPAMISEGQHMRQSHCLMEEKNNNNNHIRCA